MSNQNQGKSINRQPSGRPTGGQFAETAKPASGVSLGGQQTTTDSHGGYRLKKVQTMADGLAFTGTLTKDGEDVAHVHQDGRGGVTRVRWSGGPGSEAARDFTRASEQATGAQFEPEEEMFNRLMAVQELNRKRATIFQLDDDDLWDDGQFRQAAAKFRRDQVVSDLRRPEFADRNPRVWDSSAGDFVPVDEIDN